jgi:predicted amidohydrolase YtcJ
MLLTNGRIYTLDARGTVADTLVVRDGRVAFAGRGADVGSQAKPRATVDEVVAALRATALNIVDPATGVS